MYFVADKMKSVPEVSSVILGIVRRLGHVASLVDLFHLGFAVDLPCKARKVIPVFNI